MPVKFTYAGPHIKCICGYCGFYIKFAHKLNIPPFQESKNKIWVLTKDLELINGLKIKLGIHDDLKGIDKNIAYHNLYSELIKTNFS